MAAPDVSIRIGAELKEFKAALNEALADVRKFSQQTSSAGKGADGGIAQIAGTVKSASTAIKGLIGGFAALQGVRAFFSLVQQGVEFNSQLEQARLGIASLISAQSKLQDAQGKSVEGADALAVAIGLADDQMQKLRIAGLETAATTTQLVEAFQQAIGPGLAAGLNLDEIRQITVQTVQAAGALGVPMNQVAQEVRAILDGSIDINARVAKSLGITNEQVATWKQQNTLVSELNKRMEAFTVAGKASADNFDVIKSNAKEALDIFAGEVSTGYFDSVKNALKDATAGIFDTKTLWIAEPFKDLASVLKEIIDLVGSGLAAAITGVVDGARELSAYFKDNRSEISEIIQSAGLLVSQFVQLVGSALELFGIVGDIGIKASFFSTVIQTIAVLIAGIRDGFRTIGAVVTWLGALIIKIVLAPLETLTAIIAEIVGLVDDEAAKQLKSLEKQINGISARGFNAAGELMAPIAEGNGAVAQAIKNIDDLKKKAAQAGQEQKKAASGGVAGSVVGSNGNTQAAFNLPDLQKQLDESFRLTKDALDRESRALDQALEDRKISIAEWYAEKQRIAEASFASERDRLERERQAQVNYLARVQAAAANAAKPEDRQRAEKAVLSAKNDVAKIDADLIILERERATVVGGLARDAAAKEKEYQKAIEDTRIALRRAQGDEIGARMAEIDQAYQSAKERFRNDPNALDLVDQLFSAEKAKARFAELQAQFDKIMGRYSQQGQQIENGVTSGALSPDMAQAQQSESRAKTVAELNAVAEAMRQVAAETNNPEIIEGAQAAMTAVQTMAQQSLTGIAGAIANLRAQLKNLIDEFAKASANAAVDSLTTFFTDLASGTKTAGEALKDFVRGFAQSMAQLAARAIATMIVLEALSAVTGVPVSTLAAISGVGASKQHDGGMAGTGRQVRVNPLVFAGAPRYHSGGVVGLKSDEVPAILQKGEEVLAKNDPRNAANGGASGGGTRIINVIDPNMVSDYMSSSAGEKTVLNVLQRNPGAVKQILA